MSFSKEQNKIMEILYEVGWNEERSIESQIKDTELYKLFPKKVIDFILNFGGLKVGGNNLFEEVSIVGVDYFNNSNVLEYIKENVFSPTEDIITSNENDEYYYSVLIGRQVYFVATLKENNTLMMDEDGRFYVHTFIPDFFWIANNPIDAFVQLLIPSNNSVILNERSLQWLPPIGKELPLYELPLNNRLTKNPWTE
ncbi:SUKH-3 domain-containing protein [Flavobacterium oreochromis]|uniref:SUKH-3 domain-containing protein n=1 Tax=Flavobacterium oreochromis TaxID=2906078 RepID=UPI000CDA5337|nr:SUKH-3 domain-containing protein [Flavobacterium oreochromis]POR20287.1 hypothetical protein BWK58_14045 [Flavobacterium columnare]QYS85505.1 SUKH-3 domain-containing protein [Flavobacterium oreochromis]